VTARLTRLTRRRDVLLLRRAIVFRLLVGVARSALGLCTLTSLTDISYSPYQDGISVPVPPVVLPLPKLFDIL
jgi:hypothetical protein